MNTHAFGTPGFLNALHKLDLAGIEKALSEHEHEEALLIGLPGVTSTELRVAQVELFQRTRLRLADLGLALSEHLFEDWRISRGFKPLGLG